MAVTYTNDGTGSEPYLRTDFNMGGVSDLPDWSEGPTGDMRDKLRAVKAAGYVGVQGAEAAVCKELGLAATTAGRVNAPGEIGRLAADWKKAGYECATLHVGWGWESDSEVDALIDDILAASAAEDLPLYIETHRATIAQDTYRTVKLVERRPEIRFNADFSHWYTGLELRYGDWEKKLAFLEPVFERVAFMHGRLGNSCCMQVALDDPSMEKSVADFREMWTRSMAGFLRNAGPGDFLSFNPEILHPAINYARLYRTPEGHWREESDRWIEAKRMTEIAKECFAAARARLS